MADDETEEAGETMQESGVLEADVGARLDKQISAIDPNLRAEIDPYSHSDLRPELMQIRDELRQATLQTLAVRRVALKSLLLEDCLREDCALRNIGLAYSATNP